MNDIIHLLPDSVANQIAAGEVVQRPASLIKELVENSIDAGAQNIQIFIIDGGKTNVQVIDDGKGMSETDARLAFERHATSKILKASDLFSLTTMGFRGEALASIAAVAHVELITRRPVDELGTSISIAGSKLEKQEPVACPVGSNFSVKDLFYNIPARRKFLKANSTETNFIIADFERIALVYPDIAFSFFNNGELSYRLPKASLKQRIIDVFGKKLNAELLPVSVETSIVSISGYVAKPENSRRKGARQFFFVNGRYMRHPYFHNAVMHAYENMIPAGEQVSYFIYFSVDPSSIDVNVHPTKTEIKFDNEQAIWQVLSASVKETVGKFSKVPLIDFDIEGRPDIPAMNSVQYQGGDMPKVAPSSYNPFKVSSASNPNDWEQLYDGLEKSAGSALAGDGTSALPGDFFDGLERSTMSDPAFDDLVPSGLNAQSVIDGFEPSASITELQGTSAKAAVPDLGVPKFQFQGQYIVMPVRDGIMLIDQHRAHVRILFEQILAGMNAKGRPSQKVLFPHTVNLTQSEAAALDDIMDSLTLLGFELSSLGEGSYSVDGVPEGIDGVNVESLISEFVCTYVTCMGMPEESVRESMALTMARSSAIVRGQVLTNVETDKLVQDLFETTAPARTPDGKLIYTVLSSHDIKSMF